MQKRAAARAREGSGVPSWKPSLGLDCRPWRSGEAEAYATSRDLVRACYGIWHAMRPVSMSLTTTTKPQLRIAAIPATPEFQIQLQQVIMVDRAEQGDRGRQACLC